MRTLTYVAALNEALHQAMAEDGSVMVLGENIRNGVRAETRGLDERFDAGRVLDMPISEAAFTGFANGAAMAGLRPVVEFQVASLIFPAFDQIVNQAAKLRLMLGGQGRLPVTFFLMGAGAGGGRAGQHSDNPYPLLMHAGIKTLMPATPEDAKGLLLAAIFEDDPVALVAPAGLLGETGEVPEEACRTPLARGVRRREGRDVTVCAVGHLVPVALEAAERLARSGIEVEVWDPRSLLPFDKAGLSASVAKDPPPRRCRRLGPHLRFRRRGREPGGRALFPCTQGADQAGDASGCHRCLQHTDRGGRPAGRGADRKGGARGHGFRPGRGEDSRKQPMRRRA